MREVIDQTCGDAITIAAGGTWQYDTAGLPPCGYTIQLFANDRTIVDCNGGWENNSKFQGFCLVAP